MKKLTKKEMCGKMGYEYFGKGIDSKGDDGFIVRKIGTSVLKSVGKTMSYATDYIKSSYEDFLKDESIEIKL